MSKLYDFLEKAAADDAAAAEINNILGENKFEDATDEQLGEICEVAKKLGFDIAPDDIKESTIRELAEDELADIAGGFLRLRTPYERNPALERVYPDAGDEYNRVT